MGILRRWSIFLTLGVLLATALTAPAFGQSSSTWACPGDFSGQELNIWNWATYIAENTIPDFEDACNVTVNYDLFSSNEEVIAALREGGRGYDIVVPSDYAVGLLIGSGLLQPLNHAAIPNMVNIASTLENPPFDPGNQFSVPYQWGTIGIGYNQNRTGEITSWQQVFDYAGPVAWLNDQRIMMDIALKMLGFAPNSDNPEELAAARDFLIAHSNNVLAIADDDGQALLSAGYVDIVVEYSGDIFQVIFECECDDFVYTIPQEGALLWTDNLVIPADAPNPALAHAFIDYILDPRVGADISNTTAFATPNEAAMEYGFITPSLLVNTTIYPPAPARERLFQSESTPQTHALYTEMWEAVIAAVSARQGL